MPGHVIVAIPSQDDYVWKISSEKVPHLTLLYLGDQDDNPKLEHMTEYLGHVAKTSMCRFWLDVDRRGELGEDQADVVFFSEHEAKKLEEIRSYLLTDDDISKAYHSVEQFPSWTPHLTLGYPETPAKPDERDYPGIQLVLFDRIALWTGDYEGVEFPLKSQSRADNMYMSVRRGEDFLEHYGIKGMKWGVHRDTPSGPQSVTVKATPGRRVKTAGGKRQNASEDAIRVAKFKQKARKSTTDSLSNRELQELIQRMNLEQQYTRLRGGNALERGAKMVKQLIGLGRSASEAHSVGQTLLRDIKK